MPATQLVLRGGLVVDADHDEPVQADVHVGGGEIVAVVPVAERNTPAGARDIDCTGRLVMPGFVDTHSHADAAVLSPDIQLALLRDGVTTIIGGQDGVSFAPGDGAYATEYFRALNGTHPSYRGGGVGELLRSYDHATALNVAYLLPHGTLRHAVLGLARRAPDTDELAALRALVEQGLDEGAVGLSSGLDYVPGQFATADELAALCTPLATAGGVYVTHMRGGYENNAAVGVGEIVEIAMRSGARAHVSHYHGPPDLLLALLTSANDQGIELSFDAYPYRAGCSLLTMPTLPADLLASGPVATLDALTDPDTRAHLIATHIPGIEQVPYLGAGWASRMTLAYVAADRFGWAVGQTIATAAEQHGAPVPEFVLDILIASRLDVSVVMPLPPGRTPDDLAALIRHPLHMMGTDGIYQPGHPHPRGWGTFGRLLSRHVRQRGDLSWAQASAHLSRSAVERFSLGRRGLIRAGFVADLVVVDQSSVADHATYRSPTDLTTGIDDVLVGGVPVLAAGSLSGAHPGRGLRRS